MTTTIAQPTTLKASLLIDSFETRDSLESAFEIYGATRINCEGWPVSYGGTGIVMWVEFNAGITKREIKMIASCSDVKITFKK